MKNNFKSKLSQAKNFGSSKKGSSHWWHQRFTAIIMVLLTSWLLFFIKESAKLDMNQFIFILKKPYNIAFLILFSMTCLYHATIGMKVIIEDYISTLFVRKGLIIFLNIFSLYSAVFFVVALIYLMNF